MIWTNLKLEALLSNVFYAMSLGIGTQIVTTSGLAELLVVDVHEDEATEEEEGEEETRL